MILVTGATGKGGREIVTQLSQAGARLRALMREVAGQEPTTFAAFAREHAQQFREQTQ